MKKEKFEFLNIDKNGNISIFSTIKKDYSVVTENVSFYDCQNCIYEFGNHINCNKCNYYQDCMIEKEISDFERQQDKALERFWNRYENGEHI